ncbi:Glycosyl hydrolase catalytic core [Pirellulimonas nuda]|uniref:Glycosyl hydrolase catalytic core n=1 Tax=Pirellulimonas nuda TaxID=2528009 RepID=A0A518DBJ5_9BACT|nr:glycosyl hydrolase [Pirellulimonas nuda]QDU88838.1 Glycosyl hydrolase catalytic core [Pirellulimonas nuda]
MNLPKKARLGLLGIVAAAIGSLSALSETNAASPKIGWGGANIDHVNGSNASWYYNWWHTKPAGNNDANAEWIPLLKYTNSLQSKLNTIAGYNDVDTLLVLNEPERENQSNVSVTDAINLWPQVQQALPNHTLVGPAVSDNAAGQAWLSSFMSQVDSLNSNSDPDDNLRVDAVAFHWYGGSNPNNPVGSANSFLNPVDYYHNTYNRPVWITEFAMHDWGGNYTDAEYQEANRIFLETVIPGLESRSYVNAYAFYHHFSDAKLLNGSDPVTPTSAGDVYVDTLLAGDSRNLNGVSLGTDVTYLRGGEITNNGAPLQTAMRAIDSIEGAGALGGSSDWAVAGSNAFVRIRTDASLVKQGANAVEWNNVATTNDGGLTVADGTLRIVDGSFTGDGGVRVAAGAALDLVAVGGRGTYSFSGQQIDLEGRVIGPVLLAAGSRLATAGSAARAEGDLILNASTLVVGGEGFNERTPQTPIVAGGLNLNFDASLDSPGDSLWSSSVGSEALSFGAAATPAVVQSPKFPALSAAYSIPTSGGASGLNQRRRLGAQPVF